MEREILLFFHKTIANSFLDTLMVFFTQRGWILWLPLLFWMIFKWLKERNYNLVCYLVVTIFVGIFLSDWFSWEIKNFIKRARPCLTEYFRDIVGCISSYSFPSNHSTNAFAAAVILILFLKRLLISKNLKKFLLIYTLSIALLISLSRVYLGVHWPTDVLAGALIGAFIGFALYQITTRVDSLRRLFYFSLIIISLFRVYFIIHGPLDLSPDEAHYWEWSRRLDLSYYSKGPLIAYLIAISTWIFGDTSFGVRVFAVVFSFLSSFFIYKIGKKLFNEKIGFIAGILFQFIPLFSTYGVIFTIDSPFILFWIVSMYLFLNVFEGRKINWLLLGFFIGLGLLTKYTMAFFYVCMFIYLIRKGRAYSALSQDDREIFKNPWFYTCLIISLMVFSPVIIWNFQHDWVTLKHTAGQAHIYDGLKISLKYFIEFIGGQLLVVTPLIFVIGFYFLLQPKALNLQPDKRWFLIAFSLPLFVFFLLKSLQGKVQANWAMPAYVSFLLVIAYAFESKIYKKLITFSIILALVFSVLSYTIPYLKLSAKLDPSSRIKGWRELGVKVSKIKIELEKYGNVVIFSDRYQISSELAFYVNGQPTVYCINVGRRMNQYDLWSSINNELKAERKTHGIYVVYGTKNEPEFEVSSAFERCVPEKFTAFRKDVKIRDYTIFKCYNFKGMFLRKPEIY
ncbi:MAG: glycosyltransferase family 39 protein [Thermodesulfovibrio sp.]|nr:glycosyltransferase family 39 protein [Thermodesulfovibrio sp.]